MPPLLASVLYFIFLVHLFLVERKQNDGTSKALWIPLTWMFLAGSRYVSRWLDLGSTMNAIEAYEEGSSVDRFVFSALIAAGAFVLFRRRFSLVRLLSQNKWTCLYWLFAIISISWSPDAFVSFKRLIRGFGNVVMALVMLTEPRPFLAVGAVLRRLAFLALPLSVLFIKYYPEMGRAYHRETPMFTGVALHKNTLGQVCLLTGIYFCWSLLYKPGVRQKLGGPLRLPTEVVFLAMITWLMSIADSATSLVSLVVAICVLAVGRLGRFTKAPRQLFTVSVVTILLVSVLQTTFDIKGSVIEMVGRRPDLTTRVPMWEDLLAAAPDPVVGAGYDIFWNTEAGRAASERWEVGQAHNGYLELYLSLGVVGLVILAGGILSGLFQIRRDLTGDYAAAVLKLAIVPTVVVYNWTEATFSGVSNMWLILCLGIFDLTGVVSLDAVPQATQHKGSQSTPALSLKRNPLHVVRRVPFATHK